MTLQGAHRPMETLQMTWIPLCLSLKYAGEEGLTGSSSNEYQQQPHPLVSCILSSLTSLISFSPALHVPYRKFPISTSFIVSRY